MQTTVRRDEHGKVLPDIDQRVPLPKFYWTRLWALRCSSCGGNIWEPSDSEIRCVLCGRSNERYMLMSDQKLRYNYEKSA